MKDKQRKEVLKENGYLTVESLLKKLQELKEKGLEDELVVGYDLTHLQFCDYDEKLHCVVIE